MSTPAPHLDPAPSRTPIAFIGIGVMGRSMAGHLLAAGYPVTVHTRTPSRAAELLDAGATWADTVAACVQGAKVVITIVGDPHDVREIYLGPSGVLASAPAGAILIDMTTSQPELAREIFAAASKRGLHALDAPVSGGDVGARAGTLSIMVGGDAAAFEAARPVFEAMGKTLVYQGPAGTGQHTKMCNQIAIAGNIIGLTEALLYARRAGLDPMTVLASIGAGAASSWGLTNLYPRIHVGDYAAGFYVRHFLKDIRIALDEAGRMNLHLPGLDLARQLYARVMALGGDSLGHQALILALDEQLAREWQAGHNSSDAPDAQLASARQATPAGQDASPRPPAESQDQPGAAA